MKVVPVNLPDNHSMNKIKGFLTCMKRLFDIIFSFLLIIVCFPIYLLIAISIKLSSKGPIFYISKRIKKNFQPFHCYKFRTMHVNAEERLITLLHQNLEFKKEWLTYQKLKNDPRITFIGKWLRKTSLDELPQLLNVIKGDMSIVGPRPYVTFNKEKKIKEALLDLYGTEIETILTFKPGLTGLWQISGRNTLPLEKRIELDVRYVRNYSFKKDLSIILKTIPELIASKGAY